MDCSDSHVNSIEVMRDELRQLQKIDREHHRTAEWNKRRAILGQVINNEKLWDLSTIIIKSNELKKKTLSIDDYLKLQTALIQNEENIKCFLSINGTISALIRDIKNENPAIKLAAAHCCCNITLINGKCNSMLYRFTGPYLVEHLEILSNPLLEVSAWTIGNLCSNSKVAFKFLYAQGCISRLLSLLRECDQIILPSIIYAMTHCLHGGSELINDMEIIEMTKIIVERSCYKSTNGLWALALLSSKILSSEIISTILSLVFDKLVLEIREKSHDTNYITAAVRLLGNSVTKLSQSTAYTIFNNSKYSIDDIQYVIDELLIYPHVHVRKETLWLIGNLYNYSDPKINQMTLSLLSRLLNLKFAIQSIN